MIATGKWSENDPLEIPANLTHASSTFQRLSNFTMPDIEQRLANYDALIVVRHPLERLLSAFRNKLEIRDERGSKYFQTRFGRKIIKVSSYQIINIFILIIIVTSFNIYILFYYFLGFI